MRRTKIYTSYKCVATKSRAEGSGAARSTAAMTIIELAVSLVIIGIAIAGITELTFINGYWSIQSLNKIDNIYASKQFLDKVARELREARSIDSSSRSDLLTFTIPTENDVDANKYPKSTTTVTYQVLLDPNNGSATPHQYIVQVSYNSGTPLTVLHSIVGPQPLGGGTPKVFQYVDKNITAANPLFGITDTPTTDPSSVIVNLELMRKDFGNNASTTNLSLSGLRTEIFLRGANGNN